MARTGIVLFLLGSAAADVTQAQTPRVELDHVFVVVTPGAEAEIAALRSAGLTVPAEPPRRHEGQGTASIAAYFEDAYLELIWVDSTVSVAPEHAGTAQWFRDASSWRSNGHSPFGLGLRRVAGDTAALPVPVEHEAAAWLQPGAAYELLRQPGDSLAADLFVVPAAVAVPRWIAQARQREPGSGATRVAVVRSRRRECTGCDSSIRQHSAFCVRCGSKANPHCPRSSSSRSMEVFEASAGTYVQLCRS